MNIDDRNDLSQRIKENKKRRGFFGRSLDIHEMKSCVIGAVIMYCSQEQIGPDNQVVKYTTLSQPIEQRETER